MKKVLIITYYWPPSGGGGVQRWLKMSKYLHQFGWEPVIYTPLNPAFDVKDPSLSKDVRPNLTIIKRKIFEPIEVFQSLFKLVGKKAPQQKDFLAQRNSSLFQKFSTWVRGNLLIPDPRITWVKPSIRVLQKAISEHQIDAIITTGPPHSMHLIGLGLKRKNKDLIWIADFRDPWSEWDLWPLLKTGKKAMQKMVRMENEVLTQATDVVSISPYHVNRLKALGAPHCWLVTNGYDDADFAQLHKTPTEKFIIRHMGSVDDLRDPRPFTRSVLKAIKENPELEESLKIEFYGPVNSAFYAEMNSDEKLSTIVSFHQAVPHNEVVQLYVSSSVLLLILAHTEIADGNTPGKMFEYLASKTPVLGIGPENGDAAAILNRTQTGIIIDRENEMLMVKTLQKYFSDWKKGHVLEHQGAPEFSRSSLAGQIASILNKHLEKMN